MKKKLLAFFLVVLIAVSIFPLNTLQVFATAEIPTISVESTYATPGSSAKVDIFIQDNPGIAGAIITVDFDSRLSLTAATLGEAFSNLDYTAPGQLTSPCNFSWDSLDKVADDNGTILTLYFEVSGDCAYDVYLPVNIYSRAGDIYDYDMNSVPVLFQSGSIRVLQYWPGDVNGDNIVNGKDVTLIRRFIAGGYDVTINEDAANVNDDGIVNGKDVTLIRRYIAGGYDVELIPPTVKCDHDLVYVSELPATCSEDGHTSYYICSRCGKAFSDKNGTNEIPLTSTIIVSSGHAFSLAWQKNDSYHWHSATCGHSVTSDYGPHTFDLNNVCTVCGYEKEAVNYKDLYARYSEIGKTVDLINGDELRVSSGTKKVFTDDLFLKELNFFSEGDQTGTTNITSSIEEYVSNFSASMDLKVAFGSRSNKNGGFLTNKLPTIDVGLSGSYEKKKTSQTNEYTYSYSYVLNGDRVEIAGFKNLATLSSMVSPELMLDAQKVRTGALSAGEFINMWGTHVITSAVYGSKVNVDYYEINSDVSNTTDWKADLNLAFSQRFLKTGLNVEASVGVKNVYTTSDQTSIKNLSIKVKSRNPLNADNLATFQSQYAEWQNSYNPNTDSVFVDVGESGLTCVWYLLDDSFDDVKVILDEYMIDRCSELYTVYMEKMNSLKIEDDVVFDKETGTLRLNFKYYQKEGTIEDIVSKGNCVKYQNGILSIQPYWDGADNQIKRIEIVGAYGTLDNNGAVIKTLINNVSIKLLEGDWYSNLTLRLVNNGVTTYLSPAFIDLSVIPAQNAVTIDCLGNNLIKLNEVFSYSDELTTSSIVSYIIVAKNRIILPKDGNDSLMIDLTVPTRTGYVFGGYYSSSNGGGTKYYDASGTSLRNWTLTENSQKLYAYWIKTQYSASVSGYNKNITNNNNDYVLPINPSLNIDALKELGYTKIQFGITITGRATNPITYHNVRLRVYTNTDKLLYDATHPNRFQGAWGSWETRYFGLEISLDDLQSDGSFKTKWSTSGGSGSDGWCLDAYEISITALK